jgi:hypothetical protein
MTEADLIVWAAIFARTNMGQSCPTKEDVDRYRSVSVKSDLANMVDLVCGSFIESEEHFDIFHEEAQGWYEDLKDKDLDYIFKIWPDKSEIWK